MAIEKRIRVHPLTLAIRDRPADRCFYLYDRSKSTPATKARLIPSILKRRNRMRYSKHKAVPLKLITSKVNNVNINSTSSTRDKRIKIILHHDHDDTTTQEPTPASFSPPPTNLALMRPTAITPPPPPCRQNHVSFYSKVQVLRIPSRDQYPESMKRNMWMGLSELNVNARRNTIEFTAEGWDWRTATEEKDMYRHPKTGEYVHPVHVQRERQKRLIASRKQCAAQSKNAESPTAVEAT